MAFHPVFKKKLGEGMIDYLSPTRTTLLGRQKIQHTTKNQTKKIEQCVKLILG